MPVSIGFEKQWWLWPIVYIVGLTLAMASWFLVERLALMLKRFISMPVINESPAGAQSSAAGQGPASRISNSRELFAVELWW